MAYKNPVPHFGGKRWELRLVFDFNDWIEPEEVIESLTKWISENGIPASAISNVTSREEYSK